MAFWPLHSSAHYFSKGVLIPFPNRFKDYLGDWRNSYKASSKIGFEVVNWPLVTSLQKHKFLHVSLMVSHGSLTTSRLGEIGVEISE